MPYGYGASLTRYTGLMNKRKKPFSIAGQESSFFPPPGGMGIDPAGYGADQGGAGVGLSGTGRWGSGLAKKGLDHEAMMEALSELQFGQETFKSLGKAGGAGGGGFKLFPNSMVNDMASSGPLNLEQQKEDWWKRYLRSIA